MPLTERQKRKRARYQRDYRRRVKANGGLPLNTGPELVALRKRIRGRKTHVDWRTVLSRPVRNPNPYSYEYQVRTNSQNTHRGLCGVRTNYLTASEFQAVEFSPVVSPADATCRACRRAYDLLSAGHIRNRRAYYATSLCGINLTSVKDSLVVTPPRTRPITESQLQHVGCVACAQIARATSGVKPVTVFRQMLLGSPENSELFMQDLRVLCERHNVRTLPSGSNGFSSFSRVPNSVRLEDVLDTFENWDLETTEEDPESHLTSFL